MQMDFENLRQLLTSGIPHVRELGIDVVGIEEATITMKVDQQDRFIGDPDSGIIHGGIVTVLLDTVSGFCIYTTLNDFAPLATLDLRIDYLKPATPKQVIFASARCYKMTRNVAFVRGLAYQDTPDDPIAHSVGTFMLSTAGPQMLQPEATGDTATAPAPDGDGS